MNIIILHHFGNMGGGTNSCIDIARILKSLGHNVTICIRSPRKELIDLLNHYNIAFRIDVPEFVVYNYHSASRSNMKALYKYCISRRFLSAWDQYLKLLKPDLLLLNSLVQCPLVEVANNNNIKCVCFIRETIYGSKNSPGNLILRKYLKKANATVFLTNFDLHSWALESSIKQFVIPDIVDDERFTIDADMKNDLDQKKREVPWDYSLLYLGGFNYAKGAKNILEAVEIARNRGANIGLFILGDCENHVLSEKLPLRLLHRQLNKYIEECQHIVKRINQTSYSIEEVGIIPRPEEWLYLCDAVVFPVNQVHQARPVYEGGFFGKAAIVPDYPNYKGIVDDEINGLTYRVGSVDDLANKILKLSQNNELSVSLGNKNRKYTEKKHTISAAKGILEELLNCI